MDLSRMDVPGDCLGSSADRGMRRPSPFLGAIQLEYFDPLSLCQDYLAQGLERRRRGVLSLL